MSSRISVIALSALAASIVAGAAPATATDLSSFFDSGAPVQQKVEFGSGWYIRGDIGYDRTNMSTSPSVAVPSVPPDVLLNSGHLNSYTAGIGGGYTFNNWIRADAIVEMHRPVTSQVTGTTAANCINGFNTTAPYSPTVEGCTPVSTTTVTRYDALANAYVDLGTWSGVTPYVGAGVGAAFGRLTGATSWYQADGTSYNLNVTNTANGTTEHLFYDASASKTYVNFAWAAMAGFAYDLTDRLKLDISYRYLNAGRLTGFAPSGAYTSVPLSSQDVRMGLRYLVD